MFNQLCPTSLVSAPKRKLTIQYHMGFYVRQSVFPMQIFEILTLPNSLTVLQTYKQAFSIPQMNCICMIFLSQVVYRILLSQLEYGIFCSQVDKSCSQLESEKSRIQVESKNSRNKLEREKSCIYNSFGGLKRPAGRFGGL